jgi:hypothetical protein
MAIGIRSWGKSLMLVNLGYRLRAVKPGRGSPQQLQEKMRLRIFILATPRINPAHGAKQKGQPAGR